MWCCTWQRTDDVQQPSDRAGARCPHQPEPYCRPLGWGTFNFTSVDDTRELELVCCGVVLHWTWFLVKLTCPHNRYIFRNYSKITTASNFTKLQLQAITVRLLTITTTELLITITFAAYQKHGISALLPTGTGTFTVSGKLSTYYWPA